MNHPMEQKIIDYLKDGQIFNESINIKKLQTKIILLNQQLSEMTNNKIKDPLNPNDFIESF